MILNIGDYQVLFDKADLDVVSQYKWHIMRANASGKLLYARTRCNGPLLMHELLMCAKGVDHVNGNGLDNHRTNLRLATRAQNAGNIHKRADTSSMFKGVYWNRRNGNWCAQIRRKHLGSFEEEIEAAFAYDHVARKLFGEFARLNFPKGDEKGCL